MSPASSFPWPLVNGNSRPEWTGTGFLIDGQRVPVLAFESGPSGWSDDLTKLHEDSAGEDHPIDLLSRDWASQALRRHLRTPAAILDAGCSSGFMVKRLQRDWPGTLVIGSDFVRPPLERLAKELPTVPLLQFDLVQCPLPDGAVDAAVVLNVLEHIKDDRSATAQIGRILKPGGVAIVEVPAGPHLYDPYDEYLQHERRYTAQGLRSLLEAAGLTIVEQTHLGFSVYPAFAQVKRRNQKLLTASAEAKRRLVESAIADTKHGVLLRLALAAEALIGRFVSYPTGIRVVTVAQKARVPA